MRPAPERSSGTLEAGQAAAKLLAVDWYIDAEPDEAQPDEVAIEMAAETAILRRTKPAEAPVNLERVLEAAFFVGGAPLTAEKFQAALRVPVEIFHKLIDELNDKYRRERRPYSILPKDGGYALTIRPQFRQLREKLFGGPREARLSQAALDVLSLIAYRQPIDKPEIDALRGYDSGSVVRQLVRLGLVAVQRRGEAGHAVVSYGTTSRFLDLFHLASLDDMPRLGDSEVL